MAHLLYQNPLQRSCAEYGEEDTIIYTEVVDLTMLKASADREACIERAVEWVLGWLASDFQIRSGWNGGISFYGMDAGHIAIADGDWAGQKQECHFASREEAEADRQKNMKLSIHGLVRQVVEMHGHLGVPVGGVDAGFETDEEGGRHDARMVAVGFWPGSGRCAGESAESCRGADG